MATADIISVGTEIPGGDVEYVPFNSSRSLLDADIVIFEPTLDYQTEGHYGTYQGKPSLSERSSVETRAALKHWRSELLHAFEAGKTIFVFLSPPEEVYAKTGSQELSGTGRNQKVIHHVSEVRNYECLPLTFSRLTAASGRKVRLTKEGSLLAAYWKTMGVYTCYEVRYEMDKGIALMETQSGAHCVASLVKGKAGNIVLLPMLEYDEDEFKEWISDYSREWTKKAKQWGKALTSSLVELHKALRSTSGRTPAPDWARSSTYEMEAERKLAKRVREIDEQTERLAQERRDLSQALDQAVVPRGLLYESGRALETAIIDALETIGFQAENYTDNTSEFDVVFVSEEGRFLGEAEGRNNAPINIDKLQQLERNVQEDFARDEVDSHAKGVLFGNPHRLTEPADRETLFTDKAIKAAKRTGTALVHTPDLFSIVQYLKRRKNTRLAKQAREAILQASGDIVTFPPLPGQKADRNASERTS